MRDEDFPRDPGSGAGIKGTCTDPALKNTLLMYAELDKETANKGNFPLGAKIGATIEKGIRLRRF